MMQPMIAAMEKNLHRFLHAQTVGAGKTENPETGMQRLITGIPNINRIICGHETQNSLSSESVSRELDFFQARKERLQWVVRKSGGSSPVETLLAGCGLSCLVEMPAQWLDLGKAALDDDSLISLDSRLCRCESPEDMETWLRVAACAYPFGGSNSPQAIKMLRGMHSFPGFDFYLLKTGEKPCGTSMVLQTEDTGGIYWVSISPEYRNQGLGRAIIVMSMKAAKANGARAIYLQASQEAYSLYSKLGFSDICTIALYESKNSSTPKDAGF